jgi:hypothetical protein
MSDETITVPASPWPEQLFTAARQIVPVVGAYAVGRGWLSADTATVIGGVLAIVAPIAWGQVKTWDRSKKLANFADQLPDHVAVTK